MSEGSSQNQNAAQIAARKIKAKPSSLRARRPLTPQPSTSLQQSNIQPSSPSGALFGGSIQAPGAFSFSAPGVPSLSFGASSPNPFGSIADSRDDGRADTSAEEDARTKRVLQASSNGSAVSNGSSAFQNSFGQKQQSDSKPNLFGSAQNGSAVIFGQTKNQTDNIQSTNKGNNTLSAAMTSEQQSQQSAHNSEPQNQTNNNTPQSGEDLPQSPSKNNLFSFGSTSQNKPAEAKTSSDQPSSRPTSPVINAATSDAKDKSASKMFENHAWGQQSPSNGFWQANQSSNPSSTFGNASFQSNQNQPPFGMSGEQPPADSPMGDHQEQPATNFMLGNHQVQPAPNSMLGSHQVQPPTNFMLSNYQVQPATSSFSPNQFQTSGILPSQAPQQQQNTGFIPNRTEQPASSSAFTASNQPATNTGFNGFSAQPQQSAASSGWTLISDSASGSPRNRSTQNSSFTGFGAQPQQSAASSGWTLISDSASGSLGNQSTQNSSFTGLGSQSTQASNPFGTQQTQNTSSNNVLGNQNTHMAGSYNFGSQPEQPNSGLFGGDAPRFKGFASQPTQNTQPNKPFEPRSQQPAIGIQTEKRDLFSNTSNFSSPFNRPPTQNSPSTSTFANSGQSTSAQGSSFGTAKVSSSNDLFGNNGTQSQQKPEAVGHLNKPLIGESSQQNLNGITAGSTGTSAAHVNPQGPKEVFGQKQGLGQTPFSFGSQSPADTFKPSNSAGDSSSSSIPSQPSHSTTADGTEVVTLKDGAEFKLPTCPTQFASQLTEEFIDSVVVIPDSFTQDQRQQFFAAYRMRALNFVMIKFFEKLPFGAGIDTCVAFYNSERQKILEKAPESLLRNKRNAENAQLDTPNDPSKRPRPTEQTPLAGSALNTASTSNAPVSMSQASSTPFQTSTAPVAFSPLKSKRKADGDHPEDPNTFKASKPNPDASGSTTSSAFQGAVTEDKSTSRAIKPLVSGAMRAMQNESKASPWAKTLDTPSPNSKVNPSTVEPLIKPPTFGGGSTNFMAQFSQEASKNEEDKERKRMEDEKANDMDSDEDEAAWEAKYKEKRQAELQQLQHIAAQGRSGFVPQNGNAANQLANPFASSSNGSGSNKGGASGSQNNPKAFGSGLFDNSGSTMNGTTPKRDTSISNPGSVFQGNTSGSFNNPFNHLDGNRGEGDDSDQYSDDGENKDPKQNPNQMASTTPSNVGKSLFDRISRPSASKDDKPNANPTTFGFLNGGNNNSSANTSTPTTGRSMFERISRDSNGNAIREISIEEKENAQPNSINQGGFVFGSTLGRPEDNTWKPDSAIKFNTPASNVGAPTFNFTQATPTSTNTPAFGGLFGNSSRSTEEQPEASFGWSAPPPQQQQPVFHSTPASTSSFPNNVSFSFGGQNSNATSLFPSVNSSTTPSGASTPGGDQMGTDVDGECGNDPEEVHEQVSLVQGRAGEENEIALFEVRAKAQYFVKEANVWNIRGVGIFRVLKNPQTKAARVVMRADPAGTVVMNKSVLKNIGFAPSGKTVKFMAAADDGRAFETYIIQVKTPQFAQALAEALESSKY